MAKKEKARGFIKEFKEFALKGNMFDMAIGVIIGGVFKDLVDSFTKNLIMPIISIFTGSIDFSSWKIALPSLFRRKARSRDRRGDRKLPLLRRFPLLCYQLPDSCFCDLPDGQRNEHAALPRQRKERGRAGGTPRAEQRRKASYRNSRFAQGPLTSFRDSIFHPSQL